MDNDSLAHENRHGVWPMAPDLCSKDPFSVSALFNDLRDTRQERY